MPRTKKPVDNSRQAQTARERYMLAIYKEEAARLTAVVSDAWAKKIAAGGEDRARPSMADAVRLVLDFYFAHRDK